MKDGCKMIDNNTHISRRATLRTIGAATTAVSVLSLDGVDLVEGSTGDYTQGEAIFLEMKIEYPNVDSDLFSAGSHTRDYIVDSDNSRVLLNNGQMNVASGGQVLTNGREFTNGDDPLRVQPSNQELTTTTDYGRQQAQSVPLANPVTVPDVTSSVSGEKATVTVQGNRATVTAGEEKSFELDSSKFLVNKSAGRKSADGSTERVIVGEEQTLTPIVSIRNHGQMEFLCGGNDRLLPLTVDDSYVRSRLREYLNIDPGRIVEKTDTDLLVVQGKSAKFMKQQQQKMAEKNGGEL